MIDGLIGGIEQEVGPLSHIVATGGLGELFTKHSHRIGAYDPHLTLRGMKIVADLNR
jgi:pantothenate kinase type III